MALDGLVISNIVNDFNTLLSGGRINKINQPENDELNIVIKNNKQQYRVLLSANASLPLAYFSTVNKPNPLKAPNFCMLLRKYLSTARIVSVTQPGFERVIDFSLEHLNELGDECKKHLIIELMGKHSNIIFCDDDYVIIDSIKHVSGFMSSVREVLPGRKYFIPQTNSKYSPFDIDSDTFIRELRAKCTSVNKCIYTTITGISPLIANEVCHRASIDASDSISSLSDDILLHLYRNFKNVIEEVSEKNYTPNIVYKDDKPVEYSSIPLSCYTNCKVVNYDNISELLEQYYSLKSAISRIQQKSSDMRKIVSNSIERASKKYDLQLKQLKDTEKRDKYRIYGELLNTYGYSAEPGTKSFTTINYYNNEEVTIPLDDTLSALDNAKKYFDKYNKLKRTYEALMKQTVDTENELKHLESINAALDIAIYENELTDIKNELIEYGYMKKKYTQTKGKKAQKEPKNTNKPLHFVSSDGYHIYVGKNNYQNDDLTFNFASGTDWWFHAKGMAGSHVIVKTNGEELPDNTFEEAARIAAYYSKAKELNKAEIDYTLKKNVKKPNGSKPGFVVYYTNYSMIAKPDITGIEQIND